MILLRVTVNSQAVKLLNRFGITDELVENILQDIFSIRFIALPAYV
jgi:hypothetical protein